MIADVHTKCPAAPSIINDPNSVATLRRRLDDVGSSATAKGVNCGRSISP